MNLLTIDNLLITTIYESTYVSIDIWSILHLILGFFIVLILLKLTTKPKAILSFVSLLVAWELLEYLLYGVIKVSWLNPESFINVTWDIIIGLIGGIFAIVLNKNSKTKSI